MGAFGRWWNLWGTMKDYDVNDELFAEEVARVSAEAEIVTVTK